jgi:hypothetical protein
MSSNLSTIIATIARAKPGDRGLSMSRTIAHTLANDPALADANGVAIANALPLVGCHCGLWGKGRQALGLHAHRTACKNSEEAERFKNGASFYASEHKSGIACVRLVCSLHVVAQANPSATVAQCIQALLATPEGSCFAQPAPKPAKGDKPSKGAKSAPSPIAKPTTKGAGAKTSKRATTPPAKKASK